MYCIGGYTTQTEPKAQIIDSIEMLDLSLDSNEWTTLEINLHTKICDVGLVPVGKN